MNGSANIFIFAVIGGHPTRIASPQPGWTLSTACDRTCSTPVHSKAKSAPPRVIFCTAKLVFLSPNKASVAPHSLASASFCWFRSTAMIFFAPASLHAMIVQRPTAPTPYTTTVDPSWTLPTTSAAPQPVRTAQPTGDTLSSGVLSLTFATCELGTTMYSLNVPVLFQQP